MRALARHGPLRLVFLTLACTSWSRPRQGPKVWTRPGWPGTVRDARHIFGLLDLSPNDWVQISLGSARAAWAERLFEAVARAGIPILLENPASSTLWSHPLFVQL
eukprot:8505176-Pyramimonas_sp.AAC.2